MNLTRHLHRTLLALVASVVLHNAYAAGQIELVEGNVSVTTAAGQLRIPGKGERVEAGDTISTGKGGEIHVHMDDNGLIALRANTFLKIEAYKAEGKADDSAVFRLLRGSFRSITGWIGKNNPRKYAVYTPTATIGIRGTDHETLVVEDGADAGTFDKVNSGETELLTPNGKVAVLPGRAAFAPKAGTEPPKLLATVPALFVPGKNEALIDSDKKALEESRDERLRQKLRDGERSGAGKDGKAKIGDPADARKALAAFESFLRAFEVGDVSQLRQRLNPSMIGYQQLLDNITLGNNECKQTRVNLFNTQVQAGPDLAVVQTNWEKRCLLLPSFTPRLKSGHATVLMHLEAGGWTFAAITAGNMFDRADPPTAPARPSGNTPTTPGTTPVTAPVTTPGTTPVTTPVTTPGTTPVTPPVTTPGTTPVTTPGTTPVTTPVTTPGTSPTTPPVTTPTIPTIPGRSITPTICRSPTGAIIPCTSTAPATPTSCTVSGRVVACSSIRNPAACTLRGTVLVCP
ncbi:MAG: FecR domain-containing protein [Pseudomonadota bacterium]